MTKRMGIPWILHNEKPIYEIIFNITSSFLQCVLLRVLVCFALLLCFGGKCDSELGCCVARVWGTHRIHSLSVFLRWTTVQVYQLFFFHYFASAPLTKFITKPMCNVYE